jgi:formylglycine-generating enzyme required for sulfatase activity
MKHISLLLTLLVLAVITSCSSDKGEEQGLTNADEARVYFLFTLDTSTGQPMRRAPKSNAEVFDEFYAKLQSGELVAPTYELTLTETASGAKYTFHGQWGSDSYVTLRTGTYHVVGTSTAEGESVQERCSFTFDETISVTAGSSAVMLHADYDCFLLIFAGGDLRSLQNYDGAAERSFFTFGDYRYAFVNSILYREDANETAYIEGEYTSGTAFRIMTGKLAFETGKYYVYNTATGGFDVPPMEEGDETGGKEDNPDSPDTPDTPVEDIVIDMVSVPAGTFLMGATDADTDAYDDERPQHSVTISSAFSIGKYEVTQALWQQVMGTNPSYFQGKKVKADDATRPVEMVSKQDAEKFIAKLNELTGETYRLPTEEEWEYAARGAQNSTWKYAGSDNIGDVAWYKGNASEGMKEGDANYGTHSVTDSKAANSLGIYGMSGNVMEWTSTNWTDNYATSTTPDASTFVVRGGSWMGSANTCRVSFRNHYSPSTRRNNVGLRLAK